MKPHQPSSLLTHLECPECGRIFPSDQIQTYCSDCRSPLLARYDLPALRADAGLKADISSRPRGLWRWAELLPVREPEHRLTLGEGDTPLLELPHIAGKLGLRDLRMKDESFNPTGTFKARGLDVAVAKAVELGVRAFVIPTAGNAGGALAAYAARAGVEAHVFMPADAPEANQIEVRIANGDLRLVDGLISDAGRLAAQEANQKGWFDVSTFKEPYRVEGKKTIGLELAEAYGWDTPDVIVYPTGGGTGLVGIWKAFAELEAAGWIGAHRPRMVAVQAEGCAPIVRAFAQGQTRAEAWQNAHTLASGLRVPGPFADRLILRALYESHGNAVAVSDAQIMAAVRELAAEEGLFIAPEGAATLAGLRILLDQGWIDPRERIVILNTGSGMKYLDLFRGEARGG